MKRNRLDIIFYLVVYIDMRYRYKHKYLYQKKGADDVRRGQESPQKKNIFCEYLNKAWEEGWLNDFSDEHFLIKAMKNEVESFVGENQLKENNVRLYELDKNRGINFVTNFSCKLEYLDSIFGTNQIKKFIENQLSAGKFNYDENQFFRALSEVNILKYFSTFGYHKLTKAIYEPELGLNGKNPEARFEYENIIVDIEVKTPGFKDKQYEEKIIIPTVLLNDVGRRQIEEYCRDNGILYISPRVLKLKEFINNSCEKFITPLNNKHFNLLSKIAITN